MNRSQHHIADFLFVFFLALFLLSPGTGQAEAAPEIEVHLSDTTFAKGNFVTLTVRLANVRKGELIMPQVKGIQIDKRGQSQQIKIINGKMSRAISYAYTLSAEKEGAYTLPPVIFKSEADIIKSKSIDFTVLPLTPANTRQKTGETSLQHSSSGLAILQVISPEKIYLGESVAVEIKLYFSAATKIESGSVQLPALTSSGVVMAPLSASPKQGREEYKGKIWDTLSWQTTFSAIKGGKNSVAITTDAVALLQQKRGAQARTPFDDPFFDSFFSNYARKPIHLTWQREIEVLPLPDAGKPDSFNGAVGDFDFSVSTRAKEVKTGEPLLLEITVNGAGNFSRIDIPKLPEDGRWKTYPPMVHFEPIGDAGGGQKVFEQAVIINDHTVDGIPSLALCYFDPEQQRYITKKSSPIPLKVTAGKNGHPPSGTTPANTASTSVKDGEQQMKVDIGTLSKNLRPLPRRQWFQGTVLFLLLILSISLILYYLKKKRGGKGAGLRKKRAHRLQEDMLTLYAAKENNDPTLFLHACRVAIQNSVAERCDMHPSVVSLDDVRRVLPRSSPIIEIFAMTDNASYGSKTIPVTELETIYARLNTALERLL